MLGKPLASQNAHHFLTRRRDCYQSTGPELARRCLWEVGRTFLSGVSGPYHCLLHYLGSPQVSPTGLEECHFCAILSPILPPWGSFGNTRNVSWKPPSKLLWLFRWSSDIAHTSSSIPCYLWSFGLMSSFVVFSVETTCIACSKLTKPGRVQENPKEVWKILAFVGFYICYAAHNHGLLVRAENCLLEWLLLGAEDSPGQQDLGLGRQQDVGSPGCDPFEATVVWGLGGGRMKDKQ